MPDSSSQPHPPARKRGMTGFPGVAGQYAIFLLPLLAVCLWGGFGGLLFASHSARLPAAALYPPLEFAHTMAAATITPALPAGGPREAMLAAASGALGARSLPHLPGSIRFALVYADGAQHIFPLSLRDEATSLLSAEESASILQAAVRAARERPEGGITILPRGREEMDGDYVLAAYDKPFPLLGGDLVVLGKFPATVPVSPESADRQSFLVILWAICGLLSAAAVAYSIGRFRRGAFSLSPAPAGGDGMLSQIEKECFAVIENTQESIAILSAKTVLFANQAFAYMLGVERLTLPGGDYVGHVHPEDAPVLKQGVIALLGSRTEALRLPLRFRTDPGDVRSVACTLVPTTWHGVKSVALFAIDLTPLDVARNSLVSLKNREEALFQNIRAGIAFFDIFGNLTRSNQAWDEAWLIPDLGGFWLSTSDRNDPGEREAADALAEALQGRTSLVRRVERINSSGETLILTILFHHLPGPGGRSSGALALQYEESAHVHLEKERSELLRQLDEARLASVRRLENGNAFFETEPFACICVDEDMTVRAWNGAAEIRFARDGDEAVGQTLAEAAPELVPYLESIQTAMRGLTLTRVRMAAHARPDFPASPEEREELVISPLQLPGEKRALLIVNSSGF